MVPWSFITNIDEARVEVGVRDDAERDEAGHDEARVRHPLDLAQPAAERVAEHHEVERGGDDGREQRLPRDAQEAPDLLRRSVQQPEGDHAVAPRAPARRAARTRPRASCAASRRRPRRAPRRRPPRGAANASPADTSNVTVVPPGASLAPRRRARRARRAGARAESRSTLRAVARQERLLVLHHEEPPAVDDADAVGELLRLLEVVGREHDGGPALAQAPHVAPERAAQLDVHAGGRLVEEEHARLVHERLADEEPPLHAARERAAVGASLRRRGRARSRSSTSRASVSRTPK